MLKTNIYPNPTSTAHALIQRILSLLAERPDRPFHIALSGGSTPGLLFALWASHYRELTPWHQLRFYWVDERCVPPNHPESNYGMTYKKLLSYVSVKEEQIFRIQGEMPAEEESKRYAECVAREVPQVDGYPIFDLILLGAGDDGHTSSIFPNQSHLLTSPLIYAPAVHPQSGQHRVALTGQPIIRAARIFFLMTGESKRPILSTLQGTDDSCPAAYIAHHAHHIVEAFVDEAVVG